MQKADRTRALIVVITAVLLGQFDNWNKLIAMAILLASALVLRKLLPKEVA